MDYLFLLRDQSLFSLYGTEIAVLNERSWMSSITIPVGRQEIYLWTILDIYIGLSPGLNMAAIT